MSKPRMDIQTLANVRTNSAPLLEKLLSHGMSYELIAVKMGEHLAGTNPSVQSLVRWKKGTTIPTRANGAALIRLYEEVFGDFSAWEEEE